MNFYQHHLKYKNKSCCCCACSIQRSFQFASASKSVTATAKWQAERDESEHKKREKWNTIREMEQDIKTLIMNGMFVMLKKVYKVMNMEYGLRFSFCYSVIFLFICSAVFL